MATESKVGRPIKIAIFRALTGSASIEIISEDYFERSGNVRLTEYVEVTFQALKDEAVATKILEALDVQEQNIRQEFQAKLDSLGEIRRNMLALTHKE